MKPTASTEREAKSIVRRECERCGAAIGESHAYACRPGTIVYREVKYVRADGRLRP